MRASYQTFLPFAHRFLAASHGHSIHFSVNWSVSCIIALVAGILILIRPQLLNFIVAAYLIVIGLLGILHFG